MPVRLRVGHPGHGPVDGAQPQPATHVHPDTDVVALPAGVVVLPAVVVVAQLGVDRGQQLPLQLLQRHRADRDPPGGQHRARGHRVRPSPRHLRQVPEQRGHDLAGVGVGHQRHRRHRPDHERHAHLPPPPGLDLPDRADPGGDPVDRPGPQRRSNSCSAAPSRACSAGLPWAWTRPSRRTRAGVIATILHQATRSPVLIGPAPATTDADRSSPVPEPARTGHPSAQTGTATIRVAAPIRPQGCSRPRTAQGRKAQGGSWTSDGVGTHPLTGSLPSSPARHAEHGPSARTTRTRTDHPRPTRPSHSVTIG